MKTKPLEGRLLVHSPRRKTIYPDSSVNNSFVNTSFVNILQSSDFRYYHGNYDTRHDFKHMEVMLITENCGDYPG